MARGGARPGAGRKPGNTKTVLAKAKQELQNVRDATGVIPYISDEVAALTPLQGMMLCAQYCFEIGDYKSAGQLYKETAPYVHAKLQTITLKQETTTDVRSMSKEELAERIAALAAIENAEYEEVGDTDQSH